jgi:hypothetical protein
MPHLIAFDQSRPHVTSLHHHASRPSSSCPSVCALKAQASASWPLKAPVASDERIRDGTMYRSAGCPVLKMMLAVSGVGRRWAYERNKCRPSIDQSTDRHTDAKRTRECQEQAHRIACSIMMLLCGLCGASHGLGMPLTYRHPAPVYPPITPTSRRPTCEPAAEEGVIVAAARVRVDALVDALEQAHKKARDDDVACCVVCGGWFRGVESGQDVVHVCV